MSYRNQYAHPKPKLRLTGSLEEQFKQFVKEYEDHQESVGKNLTREFQAQQVSGGGTTVINRTSISGGGGGSGSSTRFSIAVSQSVSGNGTATVNFPDLGSANFTVIAFVLTSAGDTSNATPQIPPLSDSRTTSSVQVKHFESGTLWTIIVLNA